MQKLCQRRWFFDILDRTECVLDQKIEVFKGPKHRSFPKGIVHLSGKKKSNLFLSVFLKKSSQKRSFFDIQGRKNILFRPEKLKF